MVHRVSCPEASGVGQGVRLKSAALARGFLNHWATREVPMNVLRNYLRAKRFSSKYLLSDKYLVFCCVLVEKAGIFMAL